MAATLAELLRTRTEDELVAKFLAFLQTKGFPITDWYEGSAAKTTQRLFIHGLIDFSDLAPAVAAGGFLDYALGDWLALLAEQRFAVTKTKATACKQRVNLWCQPGTGPYVISAGQLIIKSNVNPDRRYVNTTTGTVAAGATPAEKLAVEFQAESPGSSFNADGVGALVELVTPLPGLLCSNEVLDFGGVDSNGRAIRAGSGTGTVTPARTSALTPTTPARTFTITILVSGQVGAGSFRLKIAEGGVETTTDIAPIPASYAAPNNVTINFANGAQNPSFVAGNVYTFTTQGSPIINPGTDDESDDSLRARCRGRWPTLSLVPTEDRYAAWARQCSTDNGYGISKITVTPSATLAGVANVVIATSLGAPPGSVVTAIQAYIDARDGIVDKAVVQAAVNHAVSAGGTVRVKRSIAAEVKTAAKVNWEKYITGLAIGGDEENQVRLNELVQAIMDAGALDVVSPTLNTVGANMALGPTQVATVGNDITSAMTWIEVG